MQHRIIRLKATDTAILQALLEKLVQPEEKLTSEHLRTLLSDKCVYIYIAAEEDELLGYVYAFRFPSLYSNDYMAYLYDIEVKEEYRQRGIGKALIAALKNQLTLDGVDELWLGTATDNVSGQALFSKAGGLKSDETFNDFTFEL
ncbi:MAG: hypothetical protein RL660_2652 [Bacteroidota bacterium]|jgi:GNAT superfamily N-acetyltransferase